MPLIKKPEEYIEGVTKNKRNLLKENKKLRNGNWNENLEIGFPWKTFKVRGIIQYKFDVINTNKDLLKQCP